MLRGALKKNLRNFCCTPSVRDDYMFSVDPGGAFRALLPLVEHEQSVLKTSISGSPSERILVNQKCRGPKSNVTVYESSQHRRGGIFLGRGANICGRLSSSREEFVPDTLVYFDDRLLLFYDYCT